VHKKVLEDVMAVDDQAYCTEEDETVANIAAKLGVNAHHLLQLNKDHRKTLQVR
jgi:rRNA maturation endonuclease Nob1